MAKYAEAQGIPVVVPNEDSSERLMRCKYALAEAAEAAEDYEQAVTLFTELGGYGDAADRAMAAKYSLAGYYGDHYRKREALALYQELGDYRDSRALMFDKAEKQDSVTFGHFEQDGNADNGSEPIEWYVLGKSDDNVLLLSRYILHRMSFGETSDWAGSHIRAWLNGDFFNTAFTAEEMAFIQPMTTAEGVIDDAFCLSKYEADHLLEKARLGANSTQAVLSTGPKPREYYHENFWWTRTNSGNSVVVVDNDFDSFKEKRPVDTERVPGVRPAICVNLKSPSLSPLEMRIFNDSYGQSATSKTGSSSGKKCAVCNGSGYVKYYYGASDLEAYLTGHDPYTVGVCPSCKGTGRG